MTSGEEGCASKHAVCQSRWCVRNEERQVVCFVAGLLAPVQAPSSLFGFSRVCFASLRPLALSSRFCSPGRAGDSVFLFSDFFCTQYPLNCLRTEVHRVQFPAQQQRRFRAAGLRDTRLASEGLFTDQHQSQGSKETERKDKRTCFTLK